MSFFWGEYFSLIANYMLKVWHKSKMFFHVQCTQTSKVDNPCFFKCRKFASISLQKNYFKKNLIFFLNLKFYFNSISKITHSKWIVHQHKNVNTYMLVHNNCFTKTWLTHCLGRLMESINEKWQRTSKSIMISRLKSGLNWKIAPSIIRWICTC